MVIKRTKPKLLALKAFPLWVFIFIGVLGLLSFMFCIYTWIFGLPTKIIKEDQITTDESVLVGIMSLLVTLLVAWQIYATIVAKEQVEKLNDKYDNLLREFLRLSDSSKHLMMGWHRFSMGESSLENEDYSDAYICYISALKYYAISNIELNDEMVSQCFYSMDYCIDEVIDTQQKKHKRKFFDKFPMFDASNDDLFEIVNGTDAISRAFKIELVHLQRRRNSINGGEEYIPKSISRRIFGENDSKRFLLSKVKEKEAKLKKRINKITIYKLRDTPWHKFYPV